MELVQELLGSTNTCLTFDPIDKVLYLRKFIINPNDPDDNLGGALRKRLSKQLGEDRTADLIPTVAQANQLLDNYHAISSSLKLDNGAKLDQDSKRQQYLTVQEQQKKLWSSSSDLTKTFVVRGLAELADQKTRQMLGADIEAWKKAILIVGDDGRVTTE
jgi:hypothetical protein